MGLLTMHLRCICFTVLLQCTLTVWQYVVIRTLLQELRRHFESQARHRERQVQDDEDTDFVIDDQVCMHSAFDSVVSTLLIMNVALSGSSKSWGNSRSCGAAQVWQDAIAMASQC